MRPSCLDKAVAKQLIRRCYVYIRSFEREHGCRSVVFDWKPVMAMKLRSPQVLERSTHKGEERAIDRAEKKLAYILRHHKNPELTSEYESSESDTSSLFGPGNVTRSCTTVTSNCIDGDEVDCYSQTFKDSKGNPYTCRTHYFQCDGKQMMSREIWPNSLSPRLMEVKEMKRIVRNRLAAGTARSLIAKGENVASLLPSDDERDTSIVKGTPICLPRSRYTVPLTHNIAGVNLDMDLKLKVGNEEPRDIKMHVEMPNFEVKRVLINGKECVVYEH
ncbi:hypothetical protein QR680_015994 [Steinernema hermaphroditum]|uniref:Uncharacterized protein n=1 Tax=Steinernema hermaphroditum TaxID=289476 RepID=A0AA39H9N4_9BILA|nr:hypothetical protein QR680_015994 [Steinernema hermaphroditum]